MRWRGTSVRLSVLAATNRPLWSPPSLRGSPSVPAKVPTQEGAPHGGGTFLLSSFLGVQVPSRFLFLFLLSSWPVTWSSFLHLGVSGILCQHPVRYSLGTLPCGDAFWLYLRQALGSVSYSAISTPLCACN